MNSPRVLLVFPPHLRCTEPPIGIAILKTALLNSGMVCRTWDANAAFPRWLIAHTPDRTERRFHRAFLHRRESLERFKSISTYQNPAKYSTAVEHFAALTASFTADKPEYLTPGDFEDARYGDVSPDVIHTAIASFDQSLFFPFFNDHLPALIDSFQADAIGISLIFRTQLVAGLTLIGWLKHHVPHLRVIVGGSFLDTLPDASRSIIEDAAELLTGPSEHDLPLLLGGSPANPATSFEPDYSDFDRTLYLTPRPVIPLTASRGCYYGQCRFCDESRIRFQPSPMDEVFRSIRRWSGDDTDSVIHFTDNAIPPAFLREVARRGAGRDWYGFVRPESSLTDPDYVEALAKGGCGMLQLGFESPAQYLLDTMHKHACADDFPKILRNLKRFGIRSYVYLMFGLPGQTEADGEAALRFLETEPIDFLNASIFQLPLNGDMMRNPDEFNIRIVPSDRQHVRFESADGMDRRDLRRWMSSVFAKNSRVAALIRRTPRYFKSSHAAFM